MKVHERSCVFHSSLFCIYEGFGELYPIVDVITAATPVKLSSFVAGPAALVGVTVARL